MEDSGEGAGLRDSRIPQDPYIYEALPDHRTIRLMSYRCLSDENGVAIESSLISRSLDDIISSGIKYTALSYVWGNPHDTVAILCGGKSLSVTRNLHALLVNLFKTYKLESSEVGYEGYVGHIWADAICINQVNDAEKTFQVRLMQDIYRHANHVIAWLGEEDEESVKRGFAFTCRLAAILDDNAYIGPDFDYNKLDIAEGAVLGIPSRVDEGWGDFKVIVENPWFSRVWIVQEALTAQDLTFLSGTTSSPAKILLRFARLFMPTPLYRRIIPGRMSQHPNAAFLGFLKELFNRGETPEIFILLKFTEFFEASDARDKVFAMVGLAADIDNSFIDYSQKDPCQMLIRLAKHCIGIPDEGTASSPRLEMLSYATYNTLNTGTPSWVINWTAPRQKLTPYVLYFGNDGDSLSSANESNCQFTQVTNDNGLLLRGRLLDHVESLVDSKSFAFAVSLIEQMKKLIGEDGVGTQSKIKQEFLNPFMELNVAISEMQQLVDHLGSYPTGERLTDVLWRSVVLDDKCMTDSDCCDTWAKVCSMFRRCEDLYRKYILLLKAKPPAGKQEALNLRQEAQELNWTEAELSMFLTNLQMGSRSYSSTRRGYVGWMPKTTRKGDELWVFNGYRLPFVLRPSDDRQGDERAYKLIGDCYLHGLMSSKASARIAGETQQIKLV